MATRANAGSKERFVRIDIAHSVQQLLIEEGSFDRSFAPVKKFRKLLDCDGQRLSSRPGETFFFDNNTQSSKAARIDEP